MQRIARILRQGVSGAYRDGRSPSVQLNVHVKLLTQTRASNSAMSEIVSQPSPLSPDGPPGQPGSRAACARSRSYRRIRPARSARPATTADCRRPAVPCRREQVVGLDDLYLVSRQRSAGSPQHRPAPGHPDRWRQSAARRAGQHGSDDAGPVPMSKASLQPAGIGAPGRNRSTYSPAHQRTP